MGGSRQGPVRTSAASSFRRWFRSKYKAMPAKTRAHSSGAGKSASERVLMTGMNALVQLPILMRKRDMARGLDTAGFISGYRGSPLGAYDQQLWRAADELKTHKIEFVPGLNEEIAATSVWGTQQVSLQADRKVDGVFGIWYGKGPGVDRSGDAIKHANMAGTSALGGVLCIAGDDHACKSSTLPHHSDLNLRDMNVPVFTPGNIAELIEYGITAIELSRFSGCWTAMKVTSQTIDSAASTAVPDAMMQVQLPDCQSMHPFPPSGLNIQQPDDWNTQEMRMYEHKLPAVRAFLKANSEALDRVIFGAPSRPKLMIVSAGVTSFEVVEVLQALGISDERAREMGVAVMKIAVVWPLESEGVCDRLADCDEVLVVEEKRSLLEAQLKDALYNRPGRRPRVAGKRDLAGRPMLKEAGELSHDDIRRAVQDSLARVLNAGFSPETSCCSTATHVLQPSSTPLPPLPHAARAGAPPVPAIKRLPYFCAGCPHNSSTVVPAGSQAMGGIGCHTLALFMPGRFSLFTHMGCEGSNWIGMERFVESKHVFANVGDGTYVHSAVLAVRACVAAGATMTYKVLYNGAVAMTGGQGNDTGDKSSPLSIASQLLAEGVKEVVIVSEHPDSYRHSSSATALSQPGVSLVGRRHLDAVQQRLRQVEGVTAIIFDQDCATEKRRKRKRGRMPPAAHHVLINDEVCEGCGDCGVQSNCVAIVPKETQLGRKRAVDTAVCNSDTTCIKGFCPSFVTIAGRRRAPSPAPSSSTSRSPTAVRDPWALLEGFSVPAPPVKAGGRSFANILVCGIGGTGVVTLGAILSRAAARLGLHVNVFDQVGLSQKNGSVVSHIRISSQPILAPRIAPGTATCVLAADLVTAVAPANMSVISSVDAGLFRGGRTEVVANLHVTMPGSFARERDMAIPRDDMLKQLEDAAGSAQVHRYDFKSLAVAVAGDAVYSNLVCLGMAYQKGLVPVCKEAICKVISENYADQEARGNLLAFEWGRRAAEDPGRVVSAIFGRGEGRAGDTAVLPAEAAETPAKRESGVQATWGSATADRAMTIEGILEHRVARLCAYQDEAYAERYRSVVEEIHRLERGLARHGGVASGEVRGDLSRFPLTAAVALNYFKVLAYKDEIEVSRLHLAHGPNHSQLAKEFEPGYKMFYNLSPQGLAPPDPDTGIPAKVAIPAWLCHGLFRVLASLKRVRGSWLDPFRLSTERRRDVAILQQYEDDVRLVKQLGGHGALSGRRHSLAAALLELPQMIRGYGHVKAKALETANSRRASILQQLDQPPGQDPREHSARSREAVPQHASITALH